MRRHEIRPPASTPTDAGGDLTRQIPPLGRRRNPPAMSHSINPRECHPADSDALMRCGGQHLDEPRTRARRRLGRCYELAFRALLALLGDTRWRLVHGMTKAILGHAWLTDGREVYDAVTDSRIDAAKYMQLGEIAGCREYSRMRHAKCYSRKGTMVSGMTCPDFAGTREGRLPKGANRILPLA